MDVLFLEFLQQLVQLLVLGHEIGGPQQCVPIEVHGCDVRQHVLDVEHAHHVIGGLFIHGHAGKTAGDDGVQQVLEADLLVEGGHLGAGAHDLPGLDVAELHDAAEYTLLLGRGAGVGRQFQCMAQGFGVHVLRAFLVALFDHRGGAEQEFGDRCPEEAQAQQGGAEELRHAHRVAGGIHLRQHLAQQQDHCGNGDHLDDEDEPVSHDRQVEETGHGNGGQHGDADVGEVVHHQDGRKQPAGLGEQFQHIGTAGPATFLQVAHVGGVQ